MHNGLPSLLRTGCYCTWRGEQRLVLYLQSDLSECGATALGPSAKCAMTFATVKRRPASTKSRNGVAATSLKNNISFSREVIGRAP